MSKTKKVLLIIGGVIFAFILVAIIAIAVIFGSMGQPNVPDNSVLVLKVSGSLPDYAPEDPTARLWDVASGVIRHQRADAHVDRIRDLAYSPDGRWLASASWDGTTKLWQPDLGEVQRQLSDHTDRVVAVAFRPDSKELATGSRDGSTSFALTDIGDLESLARQLLVRPLTAEECAQYAELGVCTSP